MLDDIVRQKFEQHSDLKDFLDETGDRQITHPVANKFWGAGRFKNGKDIFAKILMAVRAGKPLDLNNVGTAQSDSDTDQEVDSEGSEGNSSQWNMVGQPIRLKPDTDTLILGDSVTDGIDAKLFGQGTEKIKASDLDELERKVSRLVPNEKVVGTIVHIGINEVVDRAECNVEESFSDRKSKSERLITAMKELRDKLPNAKIYYSEALDRNQKPTEFGIVDEFNYNIEVFVNRHRKDYVYVGHSINAEFFKNRKHLNDSGNRIFIKHLKDSLGKSHKHQPRNDYRGDGDRSRWSKSKSRDRDRNHDGNKRRGANHTSRSPSTRRDENSQSRSRRDNKRR